MYSDSLQLLDRLALDKHILHSQTNALNVWGLRLIIEFDWFSRVWVVQETLLSRSAYLVLGNTMLSWDTAFQAASNFVTHTTTCCHLTKATESMKRYADFMNEHMNFVSKVVLSFQRVPLGTQNELLANLWMFRNRIATLDHDKVYGILGLLRSTEVNIDPDYRRLFTDICCSVVLEDIRVSGNLHSLKGVRTSTTPSNQASWCTDWSSLDYWAEDQSRVLSELYKQIYSASGSYPARVIPYSNNHSEEPRFLGIAGRTFDRVLHTSKVLRFTSGITRAPESQRLDELLEMLSILKGSCVDSLYVTGGSPFTAFWRTLLGDCILPYRESQNLFHNLKSNSEDAYEPLIRRAIAADVFAFLLWWLGWKQAYDLRKRMLPEVDTSFLDTPGHAPAASRKFVIRAFSQLRKIPGVLDVNASITRATSGRCMFITSKGYIGLGPEHTRQGDEVALLLGGTTPFMLRNSTAADGDLTLPEPISSEQQYQLLGDCYVHGCMDGELVKNEQTDDWPMLVLV